MERVTGTSSVQEAEKVSFLLANSKVRKITFSGNNKQKTPSRYLWNILPQKGEKRVSSCKRVVYFRKFYFIILKKKKKEVFALSSKAKAIKYKKMATLELDS